VARHNCLVGYLAGEWVTANLGFGLVFLVAASGCFGLGVYVIRAERRRRAQELAELEGTLADGHKTEEHH
jgi:hypothetical protein